LSRDPVVELERKIPRSRCSLPMPGCPRSGFAFLAREPTRTPVPSIMTGVRARAHKPSQADGWIRTPRPRFTRADQGVALGPGQVGAGAMFAGRAVSYARLGGLTQPGLLEHQRIFHAEPGLYLATASVGSESTC
jgi:hypothetical protein